MVINLAIMAIEHINGRFLGLPILLGVKMTATISTAG